MKHIRILLASLLSLIILLACEKNEDGNNKGEERTKYYFKFSAGGTPVSYNFRPETQMNLTGGFVFDEINQLYVVQITGSDDIFKANKNQFVMYLNSSSEFKTAITYSNSAASDTEIPFFFSMGYYNQNGENFITALNTPTVQLWKNCYLRFDEINESGIKGSFTGELVRYDTSTGQNVLVGSVQIENGAFYVPRNTE